MSYITVVIPNYNTEAFIKNCIQSLEAQTYKDFDVVIVDDCSTDCSIELIGSIMNASKLNIKLLQNEENQGPVISRSRGIQAADGEYIAFCDSDDWYDVNYLKLVFDKIQETKSDIVFLGHKTISKHKDKLKVREHPLVKPAAGDDTKGYLTISVDGLCALVVKRSIICSVESPNIRNGEDMAIIPVIISKASSFCVIEGCPYNYYYREGSASLTANMKVVNSLIESYEYVYTNLNDDYPDECAFLGVRNLVYGALLSLFKFSNDTKTAKRIIDDFEKKYPNWIHNRYISSLPMYKKVFIHAAYKHNYAMLRLLARIHTIITR
ncbi:MAG: glycosyltransferase [Lachnospiraceae bacterium]|jgi:glycosyltransferase involved in cell wall biosynthesis|nr:glycosyltransferase [Lachnospiraceae bacterium]MCI1656825.1 glycosyltransferase [Lachnospiraceae bacterium]MCI2195169.1 glycosyltransferase [Lachnospiraceae bacterium]